MSTNSQSPVAVVDSCHGNEIEVTILNAAKDQRLDGSLVELTIKGAECEQKALGRMGMVSLTNPYHENPAMSAIVAHNGRLEYLSEAADVCKATVELISCVDVETGGIGPRATPPSSATPIFSVSDNGLDKYRPEKEHFAVIGHLSGYPDVPISIINKGFDEVEQGGWGEAKHDAYFGRNGSGKSVKAAMDITCQLVACPKMGCLVPDTAGDLSREGAHSKGEQFRFDWLTLLRDGGRDYRVINIKDIALASQEVFIEQLAPLFIRRLSTNSQKAQELARLVSEDLFGSGEVLIDSVDEDTLLNTVLQMIPAAFSNKSRGQSDKLDAFTRICDRPNQKASFLKEYEFRVAAFFRGKLKIGKVIAGFLRKGEISIIKMHEIPESDQRLVMREIFEQTTKQSAKAFHASGAMVNAKIVLDEGPRWVPQDGKKQDEVSEVIIDAFNTTRKYGLGWTIISQRITGVSKDVFAQCHTKWFGKGLGVGADADHLKKELGEDGYQQYLAMQLMGGYPWVGIGDTINLGVGNQYIAMAPFGGDANAQIKAANPHIWTAQSTGF